MKAWAVVLLLLQAVAVSAQTLEIPVTSDADSGDFTLRTALLKARDAEEPVLISIAEPVTLIRPLTPLPEVINDDGHAIVIEGNGARLDGSLATPFFPGLRLTGSDIVVRDLIITNFLAAGIAISGSDCEVSGCLIGTDGASAQPNGDGILIESGSGARIGGPAPAQRNVIAGNNADGIRAVVNADAAIIQGNYIGTTPDGLLPLANTIGIRLSAGENYQVGGTAAGAGNVISGNRQTGILLENAGAGSVFEGNIIGMDATGLAVLPNAGAGLSASGAAGMRVGSAAAGGRNVISGNSGPALYLEASDNVVVEGNYLGVDAAGGGAFGSLLGILVATGSEAQIGGTAEGAGNVIANMTQHGIQSTGSGRVTVQGNTIGLDASRTQPLGCGGAGVLIEGGPALIGGLIAAAGNTIAHNQGPGVAFTTNVTTTIRRNAIFANGFAGIVANGETPTAAPVLASSFPIAGTAPMLSTVELYADDGLQGRIYIGSAVAAANGSFTSSVSLSAFRGKNLTATATNSLGRSSTFSAPLLIARPGNAHVADQDGDLTFSLTELLRLIQFYNAAGLSCAEPIGSTEDGYTPQPGSTDCSPHASDYSPQDWTLSLSELLRALQVFNVGAYEACPEGETTEDGYCLVQALP